MSVKERLSRECQNFFAAESAPKPWRGFRCHGEREASVHGRTAESKWHNGELEACQGLCMIRGIVPPFAPLDSNQFKGAIIFRRAQLRTIRTIILHPYDHPQPADGSGWSQPHPYNPICTARAGASSFRRWQAGTYGWARLGTTRSDILNPIDRPQSTTKARHFS